MRVLIGHNRYRIRGGEDTVFDREVKLLKDAGVEVDTFIRDNNELKDGRPVKNAMEAIWSKSAKLALARKLVDFKPDVAHFHNLHPQLSPSCFEACNLASVPVVQTLHNFRLFCANGLFLRDGVVCESCVQRSLPIAALRHKCFRNSRMATAAIVAGQVFHRYARTYVNRVSRFIALSEFSKSKFVQNGFPADRISVRGNFSPPPSILGGRPLCERSGCVYVGRLSDEKGIPLLVRASEEMLEVPFVIAGDGPLRMMIEMEVARSKGSLTYVGKLTQDKVSDLIGRARALVLPSLCYENFPAVIVEAMANGTPTVVTGHGSMAEIVEDGITGFHTKLGEVESLVSAVRKLMFCDATWKELHQNSVSTYMNQHSETNSLNSLLAIYLSARNSDLINSSNFCG